MVFVFLKWLKADIATFWFSICFTYPAEKALNLSCLKLRVKLTL